jgi:hypothetical protein
MSVAMTAAYNVNVPLGFAVNFKAIIEGRTTASAWDFGDGFVTANEPYTSQAWTNPGDYTVVLHGYNQSEPQGISATVSVHVVAQPIRTHYVGADSRNPVAPYGSWATAATNIQDAVDAATVPGALVLVTNGIYAPVAVLKPLSIRSISGPQLTAICLGSKCFATCVYLGSNATLSGFTVTNGNQRGSGGGVFCESATAIVSDCVITGNRAIGSGGGVYGGTLYDCVLISNSVGAVSSNLRTQGGGAYGSTLNNCTLAYNSSLGWDTTSHTDAYGGGAFACVLNNCIVYFNSEWTANCDDSCTLNFSCTTPMPTHGAGNITNAPLFVDHALGNLRLLSNSPCINSGNNLFTLAGPDLDGNPRIQGGTVDMGPFEYQSPASTISYAWLRQFDLPTDGSADLVDTDGDGMNNWQEWRSGTDPTNAQSALRLLGLLRGGTNVMVTWQSMAGVSYFLERSTNLGASPTFITLATGILGQPVTTTYTDSNAPGAGIWFYRVGVGN